MEPALFRSEPIINWESLSEGGGEGSKLSRTKILRRRGLYETFAQEAGFSIEFGEVTSFDHETKKVVIGIEQLEEFGIESMEELDFFVMHELGHLKEFTEDPRGYLTVVREAKRPDGLGRLVFRLYNCLMDIYVNTNTKDKAPIYRDGEKFSPTVVDLYHKTFKNRDFSENPYSVQFMDYLLNLGMDAADDVTVAPELKQLIDAGVKLGSRQVSYKDLIDRFLRPVIGKNETWNATISERKQIIDGTIRPIFERLLAKDLQEERIMVVDGIILVPGSGPGAIAIPGKGTGIPIEFPEIMGGSLNPDELEQLLEDKIASEDEGQVAKKQIEGQLGKMAGEVGLTPEEAEDFQRIYQIALPQAQAFIDLFERLKVKETVTERDKQGYFRTGGELDVPEAIRKFGRITRDPGRAELMNRKTVDEREVVVPVRVRLRLVPDLSASMDDCIEELRIVVIALGIAMSTMNIESRTRNEDFRCTLDVIGFNGQAVPIAHKLQEIHLPEIMRIYQRLSAGGGTSDHYALDLIRSSLSLEDREKIRKGEIVDILVEITDGETSNPAQSEALVNELSALGLRMSAISIEPSPEISELFKRFGMKHELGRTFDLIWKEKGRKITSPDEASMAIFDSIKHSITQFLEE